MTSVVRPWGGRTRTRCILINWPRQYRVTVGRVTVGVGRGRAPLPDRLTRNAVKRSGNLNVLSEFGCWRRPQWPPEGCRAAGWIDTASRSDHAGDVFCCRSASQNLLWDVDFES